MQRGKRRVGKEPSSLFHAVVRLFSASSNRPLRLDIDSCTKQWLTKTTLSLKTKDSHNVKLRAIDEEIRDIEFDGNAAARKWATPHDIRDMDALGLSPRFKRRFKFVAMVGFSSTVVVAWQNVLATFGFAFYNGGTGGLFWTFIFSITAMTLVYLSLAELSSS